MQWTTKECRWYEWLEVQWAQGTKYYEQLKLWLIWTTQGHVIKALDAMNSLVLHMTWTTLGSNEIRALDVINNSKLWMIWTSRDRDLKGLDAMNSSGLWMTWTNLGREFRGLKAMNNSRVRMTRMTPVRVLRALDFMNCWGLWMKWTIGCPMSLGH